MPRAAQVGPAAGWAASIPCVVWCGPMGAHTGDVLCAALNARDAALGRASLVWRAAASAPEGSARARAFASTFLERAPPIPPLALWELMRRAGARRGKLGPVRPRRAAARRAPCRKAAPALASRVHAGPPAFPSDVQTADQARAPRGHAPRRRRGAGAPASARNHMRRCRPVGLPGTPANRGAASAR
jgi:hypothetical protein